MPTPVVFPSGRQFVALGKEVVAQGTAATPTATLVVEEFKPSDKPVWLDDKGWRGSMGELYGRQTGVVKTDFTMKGACFVDTLPWLLSNIMGDNAYTGGTNTGAPTTTTAILTAGTTTVIPVTSATGIIAGTVLAIDTAGLLELVTVLSVASLNVTITAPVAKGHASGVAVQPVLGPFSNAFSLLNTGSAQPSTLTLIHYLGPTATVAARAYTGVCLSELNLKWNAETMLFEFDAKGSCWPSTVAAALPTPNPTAITPVASWRTLLGIAGPASGGTQIKYCADGEINIKRQLDVVFTAQGSQNPFVIVRGTLGVAGKLSFVAVPDEGQFLHMLNNDQPQLQLVIDNGLASTAHGVFQVDCQLAAYKDFVPETGKAAVGYQGAFDAIDNTTNAGISAGFSPGKFTVLNNVAPQTY